MLREMIPFGITLALFSSISTMNSYIDRIFLGYLLPGGAADKFDMITLYSIATGFAPLIYVFSGTVIGSFMPVVSEAYRRNDHEEIKKASATLLRWTTIMSFPVFLMILVFPAEILGILYGTKYSAGAMALVLYAIGIFFSIFSWPVYYVLSAMRRINVSVKILLVGTFVNIVLNALLIPGYGIDGAAFGSAVSFVVMTALYLYIRETTYMEIPRALYKPLLAGFLALTFLFCIKAAIGFSPDYIREFSESASKDSDILRKVFKVAFMGAIGVITSALYLLLLVALKAFEREDIEILSGAMRRLRIPGGIITRVEKALQRTQDKS
jgi:O-antigen/teichoic acid export membrane protein